MNTTAGLWIDHRKAVVAIVSAKGEETMEIKSNVDKQPGRFAGVRSTAPYESQLVKADDRLERKLTGHLNQYYAKVMAAISDADAILVFGPGEAKSELKKRLDRAKFGGHITVMETTDKLTDRQIAAKALKYFHKANSIRSSNGAAAAVGRKLRRNTPAREV
jgi:stalled ribosome rescue protein Dom34